MNPNQHGFRDGLSCEMQLVRTSTTSVKRNKQIFLDFSQTFDKVSCNNLLPRIQHYRIDAFLGSRSQSIVVNGIPQGTVSGRLNSCCMLMTSQKELTHKYACMLDTMCIVKYTLQLTTWHVNLTWINYHQYNVLITATHWHVVLNIP